MATLMAVDELFSEQSLAHVIWPVDGYPGSS